MNVPTYISRQPRRFRLKTAILWLAVIGACWAGYRMFGDGQSAAADNPPAMQAIPVTVMTLSEQKLRTWAEYSGRLTAVDYAEIRPRVSGTIDKILFEEGAMVEKGAPLFIIDPRPYEAAVANAGASVAAARTQANLAHLEFERAKKLVKDQTIAQRVYDTRANDDKVARANIAAAEAALKQAKLNLEYAHVSAPIAGRVSRAEITVGNLVESGANAPLLTSIVSGGPIYADFEVDEATYLQNIRQYNAGLDSAGNVDAAHKIPVELKLGSKEGPSYVGYIKSFDNKLNVATGTIRARALFDNQDGALVPGMFATLRMASPTERAALLVPDRAINTDQDKKFVYVVGEGNKVAYREVQLGTAAEGMRIVESGLKAGDKVITSGTQHVRPDAVVAPTEENANKPDTAPVVNTPSS